MPGAAKIYPAQKVSLADIIVEPVAEQFQCRPRKMQIGPAQCSCDRLLGLDPIVDGSEISAVVSARVSTTIDMAGCAASMP